VSSLKSKTPFLSASRELKIVHNSSDDSAAELIIVHLSASRGPANYRLFFVSLMTNRDENKPKPISSMEAPKKKNNQKKKLAKKPVTGTESISDPNTEASIQSLSLTVRLLTH
jgi:hypothetical protein